MAIGFDIVIPDTLLKKITDADDKLQALAITAEDTQKRVNSAFKAMVDGDLNDFIKKLEQVNKEVSKLGDAKLQIDSTNTTKNIDDINKLVAALEKLLTIQKKAPNGKESRNNIIYNIGEQAEQSIDKINKLINSIDKIQFGGQTYTNSALTKVNSEIDSAVEKLTELQKRINFYAKGEGQKSIAYVDIKSMNEEAKILMNQIDLLQRKRESIIANANLRLRVDEQRRIRDNAWFEMEEEKRQRERENAKQASDRARESSKEYERTYNDAIKAYSEMFDVLEAKQLKVYENLFIEAEKREKQETKRIDEQIKEYDNIIQKLKELYEIKNKADQVKGDFNYSYALSINAAQVSDDTLKQIQELNRRRFELENELLDKLDDVKAKHREKNFNEELKFEEKANAEAEKKRKKRIADESKQRKKDYERIMATGDTYDHTLRVSNRAKTLNQELLAVKALERERGKLKKTDADYEQKLNELNKRILEHNASIDKARAGAKKLRNAHSNLMNISEQLTRRLALVFSVSQVTGYVKKLASVRGEFELQQKALAAIIQNKDKANEIFDKVTKLAVQSPFQLKELVTYTKQLAAYKIETGKLYDNVKMLADISSGVGVDMSRLVLAYGQVASANYLRGTELRQFSEAGINVLGGLADYFTELYGRVVGVGEVFDMVSRRMVSFADVEEVLRKMTEAGGEFYNMQAIQAQTLRGQISNLKDSIEIMLNEIGKSQEGKLKSGVALVRDLVENWRAFAFVLQNVGFTLAIKGIVDLSKGFKVAKDDLGSFIEEAKGLPKVAASIKNLFFDIQKAIVAHPYIALAAAIAVVGKALWDWNKAVEAQNKVYKENSVAISNEIDRLNKISDKYRKYSAEIITAEAAMQKAKDENNQEEYNKALEESNTLQKEQLRILEQLKKEYPDIYNNLNSEKVSWQELTAEIEKANEAKLTQLALNQGKKGSFWGGDSEGENINDVQDLLNEYYKLLQDAQGELATVNSNLKLNFYEGIIDETQLQKAKGLLDELNNSIANGEDILIIKQKEKAFREYTESIGLEYDNLHGAIKDAYRKWYVDIKNIAGRFTDLEDNWENNIGTYKVAWIEAWKELGEVDTSTEAGKQVAKKYIDSMIGQLESEDKNVQNRFKNWLERVLHTDFDFKITEENIDNKTRKVAWLEAVEDELNAAKAKIPKLTDEVTKEILQKTEGTDLDIGEGFQFMLPDVKDADSKLLDYNEYIKQFKQQWEKIKSLQDKANTKGQALFSKEAVSDINITAKAYEDAARALGILDSKTKNADEKYSEQIRVLKELHKSYIDLNDIFDETASKQGAIEKFGNAFKEAFNVNIDTFWEGLKDDKGLQLDFTTEEGIVAAFDKLIRSIPDQKKRVQAELAKAEFIMEYRIQAKKDADQQLKDEVQKFFDNYEMKVELDKLGISGDFANALFGIESMDLDKLRENLTSKEDKFIGRGMEKEYKAFQDKLTEIEVKARQERMKGYLEYTRTTISQRAQLELKAMRDLADARKDIQDKEVLSQVESGIQKKLSEDLDKLNWEAFKSSDVFVKIFNDLDNVSQDALESMIKQLNDYKDEWKNLPIQEMKEVATQLEKMEKALAMKKAGDSPFSYASIRTFGQQAKSREEVSNAQKELLKADKLLLKYKSQEESLQTINQLVNEKKDATQAIEEYNAKYGTNLETQWADQQNILNMTKEQTDELQKLAKKETERKKNAQGIVDANEAYLFALQKQHQYLGDTLQMANDLYGAFESVLAVCDEWGAELDESVAIFAQAGMDMTNTVIQTIQLQIQLNIAAQEATGLGVAMNTAMSVIGWIVMAVQLLTTALSAIAKAHDNSLQKQIERDAEAVELLQKRFEKLEDAIDNAMSFGQYQKEFDEAKRNLDEQIRLTKDMIALEEDKKKTDKDAIKGYKDEIEDYNEQLKEMEEKRYEDMGGFGSDEAYKDAAESFIDAWLSAYKETGDGLEALQDQWDEYFDNLVKKQMMMHISNKYIKGLLEQVDKAIGANGIVTSDEMANLKAMAEQSSIELNAIMKQFADALGIEGLTDGTKLEGLSESIQGVTEVTAQALEAILNSMRFYVIDNNTQQKRLVEIMESWETPTSPILAELKAQTSYLSSIESLFNSVVDRNGSPAVRVR